MKTVVTRRQGLISCLLIVGLLWALAACKPAPPPDIADYGHYGADLARTFARYFPFRSPGSDTEARAAAYLVQALKALGYDAKTVPFTYTTPSGQTKRSQNVVWTCPGQGFVDAKGRTERGRIVIGARYDVLVTGPNYKPAEGPGAKVTARTYATFDGLNDNASGVATVLVTAYRMQKAHPGYDVTFVLFGAGNDGHAGAQAFLASLDDAARRQLACMYDIGPLYAGDRVYAHAGRHSVVNETTKSYALRRKLYEVTDVFYHYKLLTHNDYALYTNQASYLVPHPFGEPGSVVFREWTTKDGEYVPFDTIGLPIVFFESGDYRVTSMAAFGAENNVPEFSQSGGIVSGTPYDSGPYLDNVFRKLGQEAKKADALTITEKDGVPVVVEPNHEPSPGARGADAKEEAEEDRLQKRINNTAFLLLQAARRGPDNTTLASTVQAP